LIFWPKVASHKKTFLVKVAATGCKAFGFPAHFITRIENLYSKASMAIRLNGFTSHLFDVRRGV